MLCAKHNVATGRINFKFQTETLPEIQLTFMEHAVANLGNEPIRTAGDLKRFETEMSLAERLPEPSILDVFISKCRSAP
jgi:hypothetical protein